MPNWITNRVTLHNADQKDIDKVLDSLRSKDSEVDFNNIIFMPEELRNTTAGSRADYAWAYYHARELGDFVEIDKMLDYEWVKREGIKTRDELLDSLSKSHIEICKFDSLSERLFEGYEEYTIDEWLSVESLESLNYEPFHSLFQRVGDRIIFNKSRLLSIKPDDMYIWMYQIANEVRKKLCTH